MLTKASLLGGLIDVKGPRSTTPLPSRELLAPPVLLLFLLVRMVSASSGLSSGAAAGRCAWSFVFAIFFFLALSVRSVPFILGARLVEYFVLSGICCFACLRMGGFLLRWVGGSIRCRSQRNHFLPHSQSRCWALPLHRQWGQSKIRKPSFTSNLFVFTSMWPLH